MPRTSARIFAILARDAPIGVILRRGPSRQVQLIKWHLGSDTLEYGQWLKGRIYERRCDLSPSGELLLYFAGKHRPPFYTWTAISKPPYLTALALWPKGDAWGGGGLFESALKVALNHRRGEDKLAEGFHLKHRMQVTRHGLRSGWGEDFPIHHALLLSRGWTLVDAGEHPKPDWKDKVTWRFKRPTVYERTSKHKHRLQMRIKGIGQKDGAWYWIDYVVLDRAGETVLDLPRIDWADWDGADLVYAHDGKLLRMRKRDLGRAGAEATVIADLNGLTFEAKTAPPEAARW